MRQLVRLTLGGPVLRVRVSNAFGDKPLIVKGLHVARALSTTTAAVDPASDRAATFGGQAEAVVPPGAEYWSDPIGLPTEAGEHLAVSLWVVQPPPVLTGHPGSRATTYVAAGDQLAAGDLPGAEKVEHWFLLSGVDVDQAGAGAVVTLGDSITDGHAATTNGDDRWPDVLSQRLTAAGAPLGVLNQGIGGNRVLLDGLGPNAMSRFDRDVLSQTGVRAVLVLEGVNDLGVLTRDAPVADAGHQALVAAIEAGYGQMIAAAHAHGLRILGATITPYVGSDYYHPSAVNEADRQAINAWIRAPGHFDGFVDFDATVRDPARPDHLLAAFDSGDHLHPSPAGYKAMGQAVDLKLLQP